MNKLIALIFPLASAIAVAMPGSASGNAYDNDGAFSGTAMLAFTFLTAYCYWLLRHLEYSVGELGGMRIVFAIAIAAVVIGISSFSRPLSLLVALGLGIYSLIVGKRIEEARQKAAGSKTKN